MYERIRAVLNERDALAKRLGIVIESLTGERAQVTMPFDERHHNGLKQVHGGASYTLADMAFTALAHAGNARTRKIRSTASYVDGGRTGPLKAEARLVSESRTLCHIAVQVMDGDGRLIVQFAADGLRTGEPFLDQEELVRG